MWTVVLLICSNLFMTAAWYGHLKYPSHQLWKVIAISWLIALPEYALQVPANRWGARSFSKAQLKIVQEVISITVFLGFSLWYFGERPKWNEGLAFLLILLAVTVAVWPKLYPPPQAAIGSEQNSSALPTARPPTAVEDPSI